MKKLILILFICISYTSFSQVVTNKGIIVDTANLLLPYLRKVDTANIRLRPIAGTNVTITGTYPNLTFNSSGGGGASTKAYPPLVMRNDSVSTRYNVRYYGATGDSTQDATPFIQAAINACIAGGGGTVYFPNGFYWLNSPLVTNENGVNPNSQIYFPPVPFSNNTSKINITLSGESKPYFTPSGLYSDIKYPRTGVILKSTITGSGTLPAVFGGIGTAGGFTYQYVNFENMALLVPANAGGTGPTLTGINGSMLASVNLNNVVVSIDTSLFRDTIPQNEVAGVITTKIAGETMSGIRNSVICGFRFGIIAGEHCFLENAQSFGNYAGLVVLNNAHTVIGNKVLLQWNKFDILIPNSTIMGFAPGAANVDITALSFENYDLTSRWFSSVANIADTGNRATGSIVYSLYDQLLGAIPIVKYNATGIRVVPTTNTGIIPSPIYVSTNTLTTNAVQIKKGDGTGSSDRNIGVNDASFKNLGTTGNISFLNPVTAGNINFSTANSSTAKMILDSSGRLTINADTVQSNYAIASFFAPNLSTSNSNMGVFYGKNVTSQAFYHSYHNAAVSSDYFSLQSIQFAPGANSFIAHGNGNFSFGSVTAPSQKLKVIGDIADTGNVTITGNQFVSGNLAIGTLTATAPLTVNGSANLTGTFTNTGAVNLSGVTNVAASTSGGIFFVTNSTNGNIATFRATTGNSNVTLNSASNVDINHRFQNNGATVWYVGNLGSASNAYGMTNSDANGNAQRFKLTQAGALTLSGYGAGTATFDASGNITSVSDERLKTSIKPYKTGLKELLKLNPISYRWNKQSGNETSGTYAGFSAQNVKANIPFGTGENEKGYLSLQDRAIIATLVNSVKEQQQQIEDLKKEIKELKKQ